MHSAALLRDLDRLRETGIMLTTPGEARGCAPTSCCSWAPRLSSSLASSDRAAIGAAGQAGRQGRGSGDRMAGLQSDATIPGFDGDIEVFAAGLGVTLAANLAALRARVKARPVAQTQISARARRARWRCEARALRRCGLDGGESRGARNRDASWACARFERNHPFLDFAGRRAGQWRGGSDGLRMGNRLPDANRIWRRLPNP